MNQNPGFPGSYPDDLIYIQFSDGSETAMVVNGHYVLANGNHPTAILGAHAEHARRNAIHRGNEYIHARENYINNFIVPAVNPPAPPAWARAAPPPPPPPRAPYYQPVPTWAAPPQAPHRPLVHPMVVPPVPPPPPGYANPAGYDMFYRVGEARGYGGQFYWGPDP